MVVEMENRVKVISRDADLSKYVNSVKEKEIKENAKRLMHRINNGKRF